MAKPLNVLIVNKYYYPVIGGIETVVKANKSALEILGHKVTIFCMEYELGESHKINQSSVFRKRVTLRLLNIPVSFSLIGSCIRAIKEKKFDVFHLHLPDPNLSIALFLLSLFSPKSLRSVAVTYHCEVRRFPILFALFSLLDNYSLGRCGKVFVTSETIKKEASVIRRLMHSCPSKVFVIPLTCEDGEPYSPEAIHQVAQLLPKRYVLYFGRLAHYKGLEYLKDAFKLLGDDVNLVIAGTGELSGFVSRWAARDSKRIIFINRLISSEEKCFLLDNCEFLVLPSTNESEAFGIVQVEALRAGKAVINTFLKSGVPWVSLNGVTGITVPPCSCLHLKGAIEALWFNSELRQTFSRNALRRFQDIFMREKLDRLYVGQLRELCEKSV